MLVLANHELLPPILPHLDGVLRALACEYQLELHRSGGVVA
jgi:hypothetical protein